MKIFDMNLGAGNDFMHIEATGVAFSDVSDIMKGRKKESLDFKFDIKGKTKKAPDLIGPSTSELFLSARFKEIIDKEVSNQPINYIETTVLKHPFWFLNILGVRDCMDYEKSDFTTYKSGTVAKIKKLVFRKEEIAEYDIFRLKDYRVAVFVTEPLKKKIEAAGLQGIKFIAEGEVGFGG